MPHHTASPTHQRHIGVLSGSFNPVHIGHLAIANYLCAYGHVDEVWFMLTPHNPLKEATNLWPDELRMALLQAACCDTPFFRASDFECHLPQPTYTLNTLRALKQAHPHLRFSFIMGADNWLQLPQWHQWQQLLTENSLLIYPRPGHHIQPNSLPANVTYIQAPLMEISATFIRHALSEGKDVRHFLHPAVWQQLLQQRAMAISPQTPA